MENKLFFIIILICIFSTTAKKKFNPFNFYDDSITCMANGNFTYDINFSQYDLPKINSLSNYVVKN